MQIPPEMQLAPQIRAALEKIDFINRYKNMSAKYDFDEEFDYDNELGYPARNDKRENFFQIVEEYPPFQFKFNISLSYALLDFIRWSEWMGSC